MRMHEWVQGLQGTFQQAQSEERQAREEHTFQATEESQQTLMGTHVIKALQVAAYTTWPMFRHDKRLVLMTRLLTTLAHLYNPVGWLKM